MVAYTYTIMNDNIIDGREDHHFGEIAIDELELVLLGGEIVRSFRNQLSRINLAF